MTLKVLSKRLGPAAPLYGLSVQGSACFQTCCHGDGTHTRAHSRLPLHQPPAVAILADRNTFFHAGHVDSSAAVGTCALKSEPGTFEDRVSRSARGSTPTRSLHGSHGADEKQR